MAAVEIVDLLIKTAGMLDGNPKIGRAGRIKGTREAVVHLHYVRGVRRCRDYLARTAHLSGVARLS